MNFNLDINSWIYPMDLADKFRLVRKSWLFCCEPLFLIRCLPVACVRTVLPIRGSGARWTLDRAGLTALNMLCMEKSTGVLKIR